MNLKEICLEYLTDNYLVKLFKTIESKKIYFLLFMKEQEINYHYHQS